MASIWETIGEMNPLDKKVIYETILQGISPGEAHKIWAGSLAFQGENSYPAKVRRGEVLVSEDVLKKVAELEKKLKDQGIMPDE